MNYYVLSSDQPILNANRLHGALLITIEEHLLRWGINYQLKLVQARLRAPPVVADEAKLAITREAYFFSSPHILA